MQANDCTQNGRPNWNWSLISRLTVECERKPSSDNNKHNVKLHRWWWATTAHTHSHRHKERQTQVWWVTARRFTWVDYETRTCTMTPRRPHTTHCTRLTNQRHFTHLLPDGGGGRRRSERAWWGMEKAITLHSTELPEGWGSTPSSRLQTLILK